MNNLIWVVTAVVVICVAVLTLMADDLRRTPEPSSQGRVPRAAEPLGSPDPEPDRDKVVTARVVKTLAALSAGQARFQAVACVDQDRDGTGEYGYLAELAGTVDLRGSRKPVDPPFFAVLDDSFKNGIMTRDGYHYRVFIPEVSGVGVAELAHGGAPPELHGRKAANAAEKSWCAYAWPSDAAAGERTFFINEFGEILATPEGEDSYVGAEGPAADAAFMPRGKPGAITGTVAVDAPGRDGHLWIPAPMF